MNNEHIYFNLNPVNFFIISGLIQNFILAGILFFKSNERPLANTFLSITIFIVNLHLFYLMLLDTNVDNLYPFLLYIPYSYLSAIGPLVFFYTIGLTKSGFNVSTINIKHFIPVIIEVGLQILMIIQGIKSNQLFYNTPLYFYITPLSWIWAIGSIFYYLQLSLKTISHYEVGILKHYSNLKEITLSWLKKLIVYYRLLWVVWIPFVTVFLLFFRFQLMSLSIVIILYALILILTYLTFWIGIESFKHGNLVFIKNNETHVEHKNFRKLTQSEIKGHIERITQLMMVERVYQNENLNLRQFALHLKTDPNLISFILNSHLNNNFYDFVNRYRIDEVKSKLNNPKYKQLTILGIALDSGFNSKATFNRVFKQFTGITPTEFQKRNLE